MLVAEVPFHPLVRSQHGHTPLATTLSQPESGRRLEQCRAGILVCSHGYLSSGPERWMSGHVMRCAGNIDHLRHYPFVSTIIRSISK